MNYLAHTFLSCQDADLLAGNFMADFSDNRLVRNLNPALKAGVDLHKMIDAFTDSHAEVRSAIKVLHPTQGKYAPVTLDILFDYFLTLHWQKYSVENIDVFTNRVYEMLQSKAEYFPIKLQEKLPIMIESDFLMSCSSIERLKKTFFMIGKRAKFTNQFSEAHVDLENHFDQLNHHFLAFFPDLMANITGFCDCK